MNCSAAEEDTSLSIILLAALYLADLLAIASSCINTLVFGSLSKRDSTYYLLTIMSMSDLVHSLIFLVNGVFIIACRFIAVCGSIVRFVTIVFVLDYFSQCATFFDLLVVFHINLQHLILIKMRKSNVIKPRQTILMLVSFVLVFYLPVLFMNQVDRCFRVQLTYKDFPNGKLTLYLTLFVRISALVALNSLNIWVVRAFRQFLSNKTFLTSFSSKLNLES